MKRTDEFDGDGFQTEVELTAQDLLDLSPLPELPAAANSPLEAADVSQAKPQVVVAAPRVEKQIPTPGVKQAPEAKRAGRSGVVMGACAIAAFAAVTAGVGVVLSSESSARKPALMLAQSTIPAQPDPYVEEAPELPPVYVKNPFDESEIFELPAGTSDSEARAYVASVLLQRASERQAMLKTSLSR
jgi:hypothetical protein